MELFAQITKVDQAQRLVFGVAAVEQLDRAGEIMDYETSKAHFEAWSKEQFDASGGKSYGNVRAMHGKVAAGIVPQPLGFNGDGKQVECCAKVVDDAEWAKVESGTYTGFSIGGSYEKKWDDPTMKKGDGKAATRYTAKPSEISLVDRPCMPGANFFEIKKADGSLEKVEFKEPTQEELTASYWALANAKSGADGKTELTPNEMDEMAKREFSQEQRDKMADKGTAMKDGSFPIANKSDLKNAISAYGRAKDKEAAKAHIIARAKALGAEGELPKDWTQKVDAPAEYEVQGTDAELAAMAKLMGENKLNVGTVVTMLAASLEQSAVTKAATEKQAELQKLVAGGELKKSLYTVTQLADLLSRFDSLRQSINWEEMSEMDADSLLPAQAKTICEALCGMLTNMVAEECAELAEAAGKQGGYPAPVMAMLEPLGALKKSDRDYPGELHKFAKDMGAKCDAGKAAPEGDLHKMDEALAKLVAEKIDTLTKEHLSVVKALGDRIKHLEDQPAPSKAVLRVVEKGVDTNANAPEPNAIVPILNADGSINQTATMIKMVQANGGK